MQLEKLIERLGSGATFGTGREEVTVCQTHISVVFLVRDRAFKIKKPVDLGFLDFSTLERRRFYCEEEVRLNRRLAPRVYLGVRSLTQTEEGEVELDGDGAVVEYAVEMIRLPDEARLLSLAHEEKLESRHLELVVERLTDFHRDAERSSEISEYGSSRVVLKNALENFDQTEQFVGSVFTEALHSHLRSVSQAEGNRLAATMDERAAAGIPCDTHGDLRLDHIYYLPNLSPPDDLPIIDCIEFTDRFRYADPLADLAFLIMDLYFERDEAHAQQLEALYLKRTRATAPDSAALLKYYTAYRSMVRAKVCALKSLEEEVPTDEVEESKRLARAHALLALKLLAPPCKRPALIMVGGLPGTGKSTLAREIARAANLVMIRSDVIRKELFRAPGDAETSNEPDRGIYTSSHTAKTYAACLGRARSHLERGERVIVDASFTRADTRTPFVELARELRVAIEFFVCELPREIAHKRIEARVGDASDADASIHDHLAQAWDQPPAALATPVSTDQSVAESSRRALERLEELGLWEPLQNPV